jgi:putative hemolysin
MSAPDRLCLRETLGHLAHHLIIPALLLALAALTGCEGFGTVHCALPAKTAEGRDTTVTLNVPYSPETGAINAYKYCRQSGGVVTGVR